MNKKYIFLLLIVLLTLIFLYFNNSNSCKNYEKEIRRILIDLKIVKKESDILNIQSKDNFGKDIFFKVDFWNEGNYSSEFKFDKSRNEINGLTFNYKMFEKTEKNKEKFLKFAKNILQIIRTDFEKFSEKIEIIDDDNYFYAIFMRNINGYQVLYGERVEMVFSSNGRLVSLNVFEMEMNLLNTFSIKKIEAKEILLNFLTKKMGKNFEINNKYKEYTEFFYLNIEKPISIQLKENEIGDFNLFWVFPTLIKSEKKEIKSFLVNTETGDVKIF